MTEKPTNIVMLTKFGSHLYGTQTPSSDVDYKQIHLPTCRDLLLGAGKETVNISSGESHSKNTAEDTDFESFSLKKYCSLLANGQTVALDVLFAYPTDMVETSSPVWKALWDNRDKFRTSKCKSFVGYAYQQASKYGIKGSRMAAATAVAAFFWRMMSLHGAQLKCGDVLSKWDESIKGTPHTKIGTSEQPGGVQVPYFECCDKKALFTTTVKEAYQIFQRVAQGYGERAEQAKKHKGVDWKALSHAIRISQQAVEYLTTGHVTFPRPNAEFLISVKTGQLKYDHVADIIESLLCDVRDASDVCPFPKEPDWEWINNFVYECHLEVVMDQEGSRRG